MPASNFIEHFYGNDEKLTFKHTGIKKNYGKLLNVCSIYEMNFDGKIQICDSRHV